MTICPTCAKPFSAEEKNLTLPHFDFRRGFVLTENGIIPMSAHQSLLVSTLYRAAPDTVTKTALLWAVWGSFPGGGGENHLNHLIMNSRRKFKDETITIHYSRGSDHSGQMGPEHDSIYWLTW